MDPRVVELHCIMPLANLNSVAEHGLLSYERAARLRHHSIALQPVQDKRDQIQVPSGMRLHQYANMYFHARNPMLYKRLAEVEDICVLRLSTEVLALAGTVITDQNAASDYARFLAPSQSTLLDFDLIFARDWRDADQIQYWRKKSRKCAEVLVPDCVPPEHISGAYVVNHSVAMRVHSLNVGIEPMVDPDMFFR